MSRESLLAQTFIHVADALVHDFDVVELLTLVADRCVEILDVTAAGLVLAAPGGDLRLMASSSEAVGSRELIEIQAHEGPGRECLRTGAAVVNQDLSTLGDRWPRFVPEALDAGFHSAHAVPVRLRGSTFGALCLLRVDDVSMDRSDVAAAQALADVAMLAVMHHRAAFDVRDVEVELSDAVDSRVLIDQATSVVAGGVGLDVEDAFQQLRTHALDLRFRLVDVAVDVLSGALPVAAIDPHPPRRRASDRAEAGKATADARRVTTKSTLGALSHAVEEIALAAGPDATVIASFQRGPYAAANTHVYARLAASCTTVVMACAGEAPAVPGAIHVELADDDVMVGEWAVVVLTPTTAAYVVGCDLETLAPTGHTLEARRQFEASWGFDRDGAAAEARRLLGCLAGRLPAITHERIATAITLAEVTPTPRAERDLGGVALVLADRIVDDRRRLEDARVRSALAAEPSSTHDALTGLLNREGLRRWLGGPATDGLDMPAIGLVMIVLDADADIGATTRDALLQAIASALRATTRPGDLVVRWDADGFAVLGAGLDGADLMHVAERLLIAVRTTSVDGASITAAAGVRICRSRPLAISDHLAAMSAARWADPDRIVALGPVASQRATG